MVIAVKDSVIHMGLARVRKLLQEDSNDRCSSERLCGTLTEAFPCNGTRRAQSRGSHEKGTDFQIVTYLLF